MALSNDIELWLRTEGSYREGYRLYRIAGIRQDVAFFSSVLNRAFLPPDAKPRLRTILEDYLAAHPVESDQATPIVPAQEPPEVISLRARGRHLLKQQSHLRARLVTMTDADDRYTDEERFEVICELMETVIPQIDDVYDKLRRWEQLGEIPPTSSVSSIVRETVAKMQRITALRSKVSRARRDLKKKLSADEQTRIEKTIDETMSEIYQLQVELDLVD